MKSRDYARNACIILLSIAEQCIITPIQLTNIIAKGEDLDVEFKPDRLVYALHALTDEEIAVVGCG